MRNKKMFILIAFQVYFTLCFPLLSGEKEISVFSITNNRIQSRVEYSVLVNSSCIVNGINSIIVRRKRPSGSSRDLNIFEKQYYAVDDFKITDPYHIEFRLKLLKTKIIIIHLADCKAEAYTFIGGIKSKIINIHLFSNREDLFGFAGYMDITGIDTENGKIVTERISEI